MKSEKECIKIICRVNSVLVDTRYYKILSHLEKLNCTLDLGAFYMIQPLSFRNEFIHPHQFLCICSNKGDTEMKFSPLTSHSGFHSEWNFLSGTKFYSGFILTKNKLLSAGLKIAGAKTTRARTPLVERFGFIIWMHHNFILERKSIRNASHSCIIWTAPLINLHSYVPTYAYVLTRGPEGQ